MEDFDYKSLTKEECKHLFSHISFPLEPMWHQYVSLVFASERNRICWAQDVGVGKTLCALYAAKLWGCKKMLVVCPSSAFGSWRRDLKNNTNFSYVFLNESTRERKRKLKKNYNVYVITYEGLKTIFAKLCPQASGLRKSWEIQLNSFIHEFDCTILDEVHRVHEYDALQSRICFEVSKRSKRLIGMTGTLIDKSYLELFNIYRIIDLGKSLGTNFYAYRYRHFDKVRKGSESRWGKHWFEWEIKPGHEEKILDRISDVTLCFELDECFELPPTIPIVTHIQPTKQFLKLQKEIIENKLTKVPGTDISIGKKIKAKAHILRELPSGFFYYGDDKEVYNLKSNPKIEALHDLLEDTSSKIVVFYWYREEKAILEKGLRKKKIPFCSAFGGQDLTDREKEIKRFSDEEKVRVLLSQVRVASEGFDAFVANIALFFSPLGSPKMRKQCIGRIRRKGQTKKCSAIDFVVEGSLEERVIQNRGPRFNLVQETMEYIRDFHKGSEEGEV